MFHINRSALSLCLPARAAVSILILTLLLSPVSSGRAQFDDDPTGRQTPIAEGGEEIPPKPERFDRVYDIPGDLNKTQYDRFHYDIGRLWNDGLPAVIYIRTSNADQSTSQTFADGLRSVWQIESAPGADDGIVLLVDIRNTFPYAAELTYSYGANTFPTGQMTPDVLDLVIEQESKPRFQVGNVNGGLTYALRRILYYTEYTPPFPEPRTSAQEVAHSIALPFNGTLAILLTFLSIQLGRRSPSERLRRRTVVSFGIIAIGISFTVAVFGQSNLGTALALISSLLFGMILLQTVQPHVARRVLHPTTRNSIARRHRPLSRTHQRV